MKKFYLPSIILIITVVVIGILGAFKPGTIKKPSSSAVAIPVQAVTVSRQSYPLRLISQGIVEASTQASLAAQVSGNVIARAPSFERGGWFKKDDVLVTLDDRDYVAALKLAVANEKKARVSVEEEQARSKQAITDWKRLGNKKQPSAFVARLPQVAAAEAELESAQAQVTKAELDLSRTRIRAPFDGRVLEDAIDVGNYVTPGATIGTIAASGQLEVALPISAEWRGLIDWSSTNPKASIRLPAASNTQWQASITHRSANIDRASRQFHLIASIDLASNNQSNVQLLIGDYVSAEIQGRVIDDVFVIPRQALHDGHYVWRITDNKLYKQAVTVRWTDKQVALITDGLENNDQLNITPVGAVISGTAVIVRTEQNSTSQQSMLETTPDTVPEKEKETAKTTAQVSSTKTTVEQAAAKNATAPAVNEEQQP